MMLQLRVGIHYSKKTLYNNNITSLQEYQKLVEDWILFYNTKRLKSKKKSN